MAQDRDVFDLVERYMANKDYAAAIRLLEQETARTRSHEAFRLFARALYWSGNISQARRTYEEALRLFPDDGLVRIEAGRFFLETGQSALAVEILRPLEASGNPEALSLLGTASYWEGDWDTAKVLFERVLGSHPAHGEARRQLNEILSATPSRLAFIPEFQSDNQPIRRAGGTMRYSAHITPLSPLTAEGGSSSVKVEDTARTVSHGFFSLRYTLPGGRFGIDLSAGAIQVSSRKSVDWMYRIGALVRFPGASTLSAHVEHRPYFETASSFATPVSLTSIKFTFDRPESSTWIAQASLQEHRYFDGNTGRTIYGWVLFPVGGGKPLLHLGYGFSFEDTRESRFVILSGQSTGQYHPYYTPINIISHNLLASLNVPVSASFRLQISGSYGLVGSEEDTRSVSQTTPGPFRPAQEGSRRTFHPWQLRMSMDVTPLESFRLAVEGNRHVTAYYQTSQLRLTATYTCPVRLR